ncbi:MAG: tetratricopeptide repeat protein [Kiloniellales bacterium]|nr:tetratricopeptide repeat protein [Kiloniellales bacterium]
MSERDFEILDQLVAKRAKGARGPRLWLRAYLTGLALLFLGAVGTLGYAAIKHPPPPGTSLASHVEFTLALVVQKLGYNAQALEMFEALADEGHSEAEFFVGFMFDTGRGVKENPAEAAKWYRMAADRGHAMALNNLADLYLSGRGVSRDVDRAVALYQRAARGGDPVAQTNLGQLYMHGRGVPRIPAKAVAWFRRAARQDYGPAMYYLGLMQLRGWGLPVDRQAAKNWFKKAAASGSAAAEQALEELD